MIEDFGTMSLQERHDALQADLASLRRALDVAMAENEQRMEVEQRLQADYAMLRAVARRIFTESVSEQSLQDLLNLADAVEHPGAALVIRYNRAKAVVEAARLLDGNGTTEAVWDRLWEAIAAHDAPLKEGKL